MKFDKSKFRVAAFDIDGTLYERGSMLDQTRNAVLRLHESGVETVIATGRHPFNLPEQVQAMPCFRYAIGLNGGMVADFRTKEVFALTAMNVETARETAKTMWQVTDMLHIVHREHGVITRCDIEWIVSKYGDLEKQKVVNKELRNIYRVVETAEGLVEGIREPMIKAGARFCTTEATKQGALLLKELLPEHEVVITDSNMVEVTPRGVSKAKGLELLCQKLGCTPENAIAFGDSGNDINMLMRAGYSVAMGNASEDVKAIADYVTDSVQNAGIAKAIGVLFGL